MTGLGYGCLGCDCIPGLPDLRWQDAHLFREDNNAGSIGGSGGKSTRSGRLANGESPEDAAPSTAVLVVVATSVVVGSPSGRVGVGNEAATAPV